jgi:predicted site-specific integrase-resolvase
MKLYTISQASKILNIANTTLHIWCTKNIIKYTVLPNGHRRFSEFDLEQFVNSNTKKLKIKRKTVIYCRVSTSLQKENLERQKQRLQDFCASKGMQIDLILEDIASGMNFNRVNFLKLIQLILSDQVENIIIEYKDRLLRFGFELIKHICSYMNTNIIILNESETLDYRKEITNDLIAIIHHFSMKLYGSRRGKQKLNIIKKELFINENVSN